MMYAMCVNDENTEFRLNKGEEYLVLGVRKFDGFGDTFYILDIDGLAYASCHFSVTYLK